MTPRDSEPFSPIQVARWPTEQALTILTILFAIMMWGVLIISIFGIAYGLMIGVFFFVAHVIFIAHIRGNGVRLSPEQFPDLYTSVENLSKRMGFQTVPEAYLIQEGGALNALATRFFKANMIVLYSDLIEACGENKAARDMIVAHELGHLKEGHLKWHWFLLPGLMIPFLGQALSRAREYTSDRYGLAGAGNKEGALVGLTILAAGAEHGPRVNLSAMAKQVEHLNTGWMTIGEWLSTHPPLSKRIIALDQALRPAQNYTQRGILRALGIIGLIYIVPTILIVLAIIGVTILNVASLKEPLKQPLSFEKKVMPKETQKAEEDIEKLKNFVQSEWKAKKGIPKNQIELYQRWLEAHPNQKEPRDPLTNARYNYSTFGEDLYEIWTDGPDRKSYTDDDITSGFVYTKDKYEKDKEVEEK